MKKLLTLIFISVCSLLLSACYRMRASHGGGQTSQTQRNINAADVSLLPGYKIELVAQQLTFPTDVAFDENGKLYVIEAGYAYGEVWNEPKLIRLESNGTRTVLATGTRNGPWNGVIFHDGYFYVAEGGEAEGGKILRISPGGEIKVLIEDLPSVGDHHTNGPVIKDGYIYFSQGTATNSGVVGEDNAAFGWLKRYEDFRDIPCRDIILTGENFQTPNVLTEAPDDKAITGAFSSFGNATTPGQIINGSVPCTGAVLRVPLTGGEVELVAWGLRNPFGLAVSPDGKLYTTENAYDVRGSRPVWGTGDVLWEVKQDMWYGWPDFSAGEPISYNKEFKSPGKDVVKPLLQKYPGTPPKPTAILGVHSSSNGFDFSTNPVFGYEGEAFIAQFGDMAPNVGKVMKPVGFKVVRVNVNTGVVRDFAVNKGKRNGPATWLNSGGLERPVSVKFDPIGTTLYVVDFGIVLMTKKGAKPIQQTGVIWKITKEKI